MLVREDICLRNVMRLLESVRINVIFYEKMSYLEAIWACL